MKIVTMDGNEACAYTSYLFTEVAGIYPITPSSPMAEHIDEWSNKGKLNIFNDKVKIVEMQSEAGAAGFVHGSLQNGVLASTYTASQGLLLMIPNMYKIAGEMLPGVIHVAARSLSTHALSIFGDHQDVYACRSTGFCMLASSSVQDCANLSGVAHLASIKSSLPFLHFFDGFRTSHEINKINLLEKSDYEDLIDYDSIESFRKRALKINKPITVGTNQNDDIYFQITESRNKDYDNVADTVNEYMNKINEKTGMNYKPFNYYGSDQAKKVIVAMGSVCETIKEVIDTKKDVGLVEVHLYRPFSSKYLLNILPDSVEKIAVLDRTKESGSIGEPLYLDICAALKNKDIKIVGGRYGLSSKNTTPSQINAVYEMLNNPVNNFTIGIDDDVTNLSLKPIDIDVSSAQEILIYGYGSDGMVSASKSLIKLIGDNTKKYVQGYFQYDSKKSGGVTVSHLRVSDDHIRSTYYVEKPSIFVVSKDTYLSDIHLVDRLEKDSICIINTNKTDEQINDIINPLLANLLVENDVKVYKLDAYDIAKSVGLNNKISMIMEDAILFLTNYIDYNIAKEKLITFIKEKFKRKGSDIVKANIMALDQTEKSLEEIVIRKKDANNNLEKDTLDMIGYRKGNDVKVSDLVEYKNGKFKARNITYSNNETVPYWIRENCINCNQCSFVCPHSVIKPFLLSEEEYNNSPEYVKSICMKAIGYDYYYALGIAVNNCTGCGLCIKTCPGKRGEKALDSIHISKTDEQKIFDYLSTNISDKGIDPSNVKTSQFKDSKFKYCGACAGCGETAYIKLLTQLFGDNLMIANATGCSSIYGGSVPSLPYSIPWASSLFEDNAEYGYGMLLSTNTIRNRIKNIMMNNMNNSNSELFKKWLDNYDNYNITKDVYDSLNDDIPNELKSLKDYIVSRNIWCIGGDGWAYDIGFGGIDHVLSSDDNINILVLDTELYSNTGGQSSKSSPKGSIESFAGSGKKTNKKDLARIAMSYPNCYVAQVSLGANQMQLIKALKEANDHQGPSIVIAYAPCISHGIKGGMINSLEMEKQAVLCGYYPLFRYHPINGFTLDSKNVDFDKYEIFLNNQMRFALLKKVNPEKANELLKQNKENAIIRYKHYQNIIKE